MADLKTEEFELRITAGKAVSADRRFRADDLRSGGHYMPLDTYFMRADGTVIRRAWDKGERRISNQTLPRLACQIFERQLTALSVEAR